jgi:hypothetical protein
MAVRSSWSLLVPQERFHCFAEVFHEMKAIDDLHRVGCPLANAVRIEATPIATDHGDRRMPGEPGRHRRGRAIRQPVYHAMIREIDHDGAKAPASPPRPRIHPDGLEGWGVWYRGYPYQPEQGSRTGWQPTPFTSVRSEAGSQKLCSGPGLSLPENFRYITHVARRFIQQLCGRKSLR